MNVVFFVTFLVQKVGCFKDTGRRAIPQLDGKSILLRGPYRRRKLAIQKCALETARRGYLYFGVQHGGWCASGPRAHRTYAKYGRSNRCRNGKGGPWANDVYRVSGICQSYLVTLPNGPLFASLVCQTAEKRARLHPDVAQQSVCDWFLLARENSKPDNDQSQTCTATSSVWNVSGPDLSQATSK